jgi:hypothetical protein
MTSSSNPDGADPDERVTLLRAGRASTLLTAHSSATRGYKALTRSRQRSSRWRSFILSDLTASTYGVFFGTAAIVAHLGDARARDVLYVALIAAIGVLTLLSVSQWRSELIGFTRVLEVTPFVTAVMVAALISSLRGIPVARSLEVSTAVIIAFLGLPLVIKSDRDIRAFVVGLSLPSLWAVLRAAQIALANTNIRLGLVVGGNPIVAGRAAGLVLVVLAYLLLVSRGVGWLVRGFALLLTPAVAIVLLQAGSRGPITATVAAVGVLLFRRVSRNRRAKRGLARKRWLTLAIGAFASFTAYSSGGFEFQRRLRAPISEEIARRDLALAGMETATRYPFGAGIGGFGTNVYGDPTAYPHNILVEIAADMGIIALVAFLVLLFRSIRRLSRVRNNESTLVLALLAYSLTNASVSSNLTGNRIVLCAIALGLLIDRCKAPLAAPSRSLQPASQFHDAKRE